MLVYGTPLSVDCDNFNVEPCWLEAQYALGIGQSGEHAGGLVAEPMDTLGGLAQLRSSENTLYSCRVADPRAPSALSNLRSASDGGPVEMYEVLLLRRIYVRGGCLFCSE